MGILTGILTGSNTNDDAANGDLANVDDHNTGIRQVPSSTRPGNSPE